MNKVILMGRLTNDPEVSYSGRGKDKLAIARFTVAVNYNAEHADFIRCACFGTTAETAEEYLFKGTKILIDGRWQTGSYEKDGETKYTNECVINRFEFCEKAEDGGNDSKGSNSSNRGRSR